MSFNRTLVPSESKSFDIPKWIYATCTDGVNLTCYNSTDLFSAAIPAALGTTLLEGPVVLSGKFFGITIRQEDMNRINLSLVGTHDSGAPRWSQQHLGVSTFVDAGMQGFLSAAKAKGAETIVKIYDTPSWAASRPGEVNAYGTPGGNTEPASMTNLANYVTWLMTTYGADIDYLDVWNEPKYNTVASSFFSGTPTKLAEMARTIFQAAKAVKPSVQIMGVGCTGITSNGAGSGIDYCNQFLAASDGAAGIGANWINILSVHTYIHDTLNTLTALTAVKGFLDTIKTANGISAKPVWATEFGYIDPQFTSYPGPIDARMRTYIRYVMYNIVAGMQRVLMYSYNSGLGWGKDPAGDVEWNNWAQILNGATVTRINRIGAAGQLACVIGGVNYLI